MSLKIVTKYKEKELMHTEVKDYENLRDMADKAYGQFEVVCDALSASWERGKECGDPSLEEATRTLEELFDKTMNTFYELYNVIQDLPKAECEKCGEFISWHDVSLRHCAGEGNICSDCAHSKNTTTPSA